MISIKRYLYLTFICFVFTSTLNAQGTLFTETKDCRPPKNRELFHDFIDKEQKNILISDGKVDGVLNASSNDEINFMATRALVNEIDGLQCKIELDTLMRSQVKIGYLRGLERLLRYINGNLRNGNFNPANMPGIIQAYETVMNVDKNGETIENLITSYSYEISNAIIQSDAFEKNAGIKKSREIVLKKYCALHPDRIFQTLKQNPNVSFFDSLVKIAGYKYPHLLYDYAAANNRLGYEIRRIDDPLVRSVSKMATSGGSGQLYFPFLDNILKGKMTFEDIDAVKKDSIKYYKLLVKTRLDYVERALNKDTAFESEGLSKMLEKKAIEIFVNTINGLHELDDPVRFRILQQLNAQELYYLAVLSDGIIYTSSYVRGVYPLMMSRIGQRGDSLMMSVKFDRFKKFIKIAAAYNTLNNFLSTFPNQEDAQTLMTAFVNGLEKASGLEDGVDVADSYTSISEGNKELANYILGLTKWNYEKNVSRNNRRGIVIYNLLYKLFLSADSTNNIDISKELHIPPVYGVNYSSLANDSGQVVMQVFFYGDKDGQNIFQGFQKMFGSSNWKIIPSQNWITITSTKGKPIMIFANRPLPEETGDDEKAQQALDDYLNKRGLKPTVVIHRGHSYYAPYTISQILPSAKIVFLGSCGGFHLIHDILKNAPDAHIIASKQIGKTAINRPFFEQLMETVRNGKNIEWIAFWQDLEKKVKVEGFEDYIPPHKNLGAIFIKAYKIAMGEGYAEE